METHFVSSLCSEVGYDAEQSWGYITVGGTTSNMEGLWIARNKAKKSGKKPKYVLASEDSHYSVSKACDILGLKVKKLEVNAEINPKKIAAVVCTIGTTETGRVDDVSFWVQYCQEFGIHCHVDAAYGGYFIYAKESEFLSEEARRAFGSLSLCDSISIDPHKMGYAPYPSGLFLLKNRNDCSFVALDQSVPYLNAPTTSAYTIEGSRSGAYAAAIDFGHDLLKNHYPVMMSSILEAVHQFKEAFVNSRHFELFKGKMDLGMLLFKTRDENPPMSYFAEKFT
jgi:tyrosine decarboxylase/aspartate 1-decarboxylase